MVVWLYVGWHAEHKHEHDDGEEVENCILFRFLYFREAWKPALANLIVEAAGAVASAGVCCTLPDIVDGDLAVSDGGRVTAVEKYNPTPTIAML